MAKKIMAIVKLQIPGGEAKPSPPVGPALGQHGVNIMEFCKAFNAQTQNRTRSHHTGADHRLRGPLVQFCAQDSARFLSCSRKRPVWKKGLPNRTGTR